MSKLRIAIISDLHIGRTARSKELCPHDDYKGSNEASLQGFSEFIKKERIEPHYLIIPGDITDRGDPLEFKLASETITRIGNILNIQEEKLLFVPGNHDQNWSALSQNGEDHSGIEAAHMYQSLEQDDLIFRNILRRSSHCMLSENCQAIWKFNDLFVVGYNSSWHLRKESENYYGLVKQNSLDWLEEQLMQIDQLEPRIKIFLVHHHPIQYSNHIPDQPDFSIMTNAENLMKLLSRGFNFEVQHLTVAWYSAPSFRRTPQTGF